MLLVSKLLFAAGSGEILQTAQQANGYAWLGKMYAIFSCLDVTIIWEACLHITKLVSMTKKMPALPISSNM